jgi:hypothetical protein
MAGTYIDINTNRRAVVRFVDQANTVASASFVVNNFPLTDMSITRILWTGPGWSITATPTGGNSAVVFDCGNSAWGVVDLGDRGTVIPLGFQPSITAVNTAPAGTLIIELHKATN